MVLIALVFGFYGATRIIILLRDNKIAIDNLQANNGTLSEVQIKIKQIEMNNSFTNAVIVFFSALLLIPSFFIALWCCFFGKEEENKRSLKENDYKPINP